MLVMKKERRGERMGEIMVVKVKRGSGTGDGLRW